MVMEQCHGVSHINSNKSHATEIMHTLFILFYFILIFGKKKPICSCHREKYEIPGRANLLKEQSTKILDNSGSNPSSASTSFFDFK